MNRRENGRLEPERNLATDLASALMFRELALSYLHSLGNALFSIASQVLDMQADPAVNSDRYRRKLDELLMLVGPAKHQVATIQEVARPGTRKPKEFFITSEVVRRAIEMVARQSPPVHMRESFGQYDYMVKAERELIEQAVLNLLHNAHQSLREKTPPHREIFVFIREDRSEEGYFRISIRDSGHGIPPELMKKVFHPAFTTRSSGSGYGLYVARALIEQCGGRLGLERSIVGKGTTFVITLPFVRKVAFEGSPYVS